jgi:Virulence factor BrkB
MHKHFFWTIDHYDETCTYRSKDPCDEFGSAFAAIGWLVVSILFSWYAANFGSYNKTYGSLGAVVGLMTWMWLSSIARIIDKTLWHNNFC